MRDKKGRFVKGSKPEKFEKKRLKGVRKALKIRNARQTPEDFRKVQEKAWKAIRKPWSRLGYNGKHKRVRQKWGIPKTCDLCKTGNITGRKVHWANKDHRYRQNRENWFKVCRPCHAKWDKENNGTDFRPMNKRNTITIG